MSAIFTRSTLRQDVTDLIHGTPDLSGTTILDRILNAGVREVVADVDVDLRSTRRSIALAPAGRDDIIYDEETGTYDTPVLLAVGAEADQYAYHCPDDLKGNKVIDIKRRTSRTRRYTYVNPEEFDVMKTVRDDIYTVTTVEGIRRILVSGIDALTSVMFHNCDTYNGNGTFTSVGSAASIATSARYIEGTGAVSFTSGTGATTSGIQITSGMAAVNAASVLDQDVYVWVYIPNATDITQWTLRWGSGTSNYWQDTVTATADRVAFFAGWNLLKFDWASATETGTPDATAITYLSLFMTKGIATASYDGFIVDRIAVVEDSEIDVLYYSRYPWQTALSVWQETATADTDLLNADTDEYDLFVFKVAQRLSLYLKLFDDVQVYKGMYDEKRLAFMGTNPSEAQLQTSTYQDINSYDPIDTSSE
jgi:hypothetical protein